MYAGAKARMGFPYRFFQEWVDWGDVMATEKRDGTWRRSGYNCTSSYNSIFGEMGEEGYDTYPQGGTTNYAANIGSDPAHNKAWERFNINKNYPTGTFLVSPYIDHVYQGHNAMVLTGEEGIGGYQMMLGSDAHQGITGYDDYGLPMWGQPGMNEVLTMAETEAFSAFVWAGMMPGVPVLDGFPGYDASARDLNRWYRAVSEWFELPPNAITNAILTENTPCADPDRDVEDIRDAAGYMSPVDHNSYGALQQQWQWWPMPWVMEVAAWSFGYRMWQYKESHGADDARGLAEWIQKVQQSFADGSDGNPLGWNYEQHFAWSLDLTREEESGDEGSGDAWTNVEGLWVPGNRGRTWAEVKDDGKVEVHEWE